MTRLTDLVRSAARRLRTVALAGRSGVARMGAAWASIRPRGRRRTLRAAGLVTGGAVSLAILLYGALWGGLALAAPYVEVTLHPTWNAETQAGRELSYAGAATCSTCHQPEVTKLVSSKHAGIGCESCHGALLAHAASSPGPAADSQIGTPTSELCVKCHAQTDGRPAGFPQVDVAGHYVDDCLACHNPHSGISRRPPLVVHPVEGIPACITCHGNEGFKARDIRHPTVSSDDAACLACHEAKPAGASAAPVASPVP